MTDFVESNINRVLRHLRSGYRRVEPDDLIAEAVSGALIVDIRPLEQRQTDGELPGAVVIDRNVLEWRLDPTSPSRIPETAPDRRIILVCNEGYSSTLAAASLHAIGLEQATDLVEGFRGLHLTGVLITMHADLDGHRPATSTSHESAITESG